MNKILINIIIIFVLFSCKNDEGCMDPSALNYNSDATTDNNNCIYDNSINLTINFTHSVDGNPLIIDSIFYSLQNNNKYSIQTVRYLISNIVLRTENGNSVLLDSVHFVDIANSSSLNINFSNLTNINYTSISFTMGLDSTKNQTNLYLNENFFPSFVWPDLLGGGYHYMQIEGDLNTIFNGYATHTGATNGKDYSFYKEFPITFINNNKHHYISIDMDIANWYRNPNIFILTTNGIMGDPNSQVSLKANGIADVFSVNYESK